MNNEKIYKSIEMSPDINEKKLLLVDYLKTTLPLLRNKESYQDAVYDIAGMMSTDYVRLLPDSDQIVQILIMAGELEVPGDNTNDKLNSLISLIDKL